MSNFCSDQGRTRVFGPRSRDRKAYGLYAAAGNPRRTPSRTKMAIYGWTLLKKRHLSVFLLFPASDRPLSNLCKNTRSKICMASPIQHNLGNGFRSAFLPVFLQLLL